MIMVANEEEKWELDDSQGDYKDGNPNFVKLSCVS